MKKILCFISLLIFNNQSFHYDHFNFESKNHSNQKIQISNSLLIAIGTISTAIISYQAYKIYTNNKKSSAIKKWIYNFLQICLEENYKIIENKLEENYIKLDLYKKTIEDENKKQNNIFSKILSIGSGIVLVGSLLLLYFNINGFNNANNDIFSNNTILNNNYYINQTRKNKTAKDIIIPFAKELFQIIKKSNYFKTHYSEFQSKIKNLIDISNNVYWENINDIIIEIIIDIINKKLIY